MNRRDFLKAGAVLAAGLASAPAAARQQVPPRKVKSVIWLWLEGAPSQYEMWDPKPDHRNGGGVKSIETVAKGIRIAETLPRCAEVMDRLSLIRTVSHAGRDSAESTYLMHAGLYPSCWDSDVSVGSALAYELWNRDSGAPPFVAIDAPAIPESWSLGDLYLPLRLRGGKAEPARAPSREWIDLLKAQDEAWATARQYSTLAQITEMRNVASRAMKAPLASVLDLAREPKELREAYGQGFGQRCLAARRLIESGTAVVEVALGGLESDWRRYYAQLDSGLSTLIQDLTDRGMFNDTVVFVASEAGRYPAVMEERTGERWTQGFSVALAGGHLAGGRAYGETGEGGLGSTPVVPLWNLFATLFTACGVDYNKKYETIGRKVKYVSINGAVSTTGRPIRDLF
jgi:hypothetical protein